MMAESREQGEGGGGGEYYLPNKWATKEPHDKYGCAHVNYIED